MVFSQTFFFLRGPLSFVESRCLEIRRDNFFFEVTSTKRGQRITNGTRRFPHRELCTKQNRPSTMTSETMVRVGRGGAGNYHSAPAHVCLAKIPASRSKYGKDIIDGACGSTCMKWKANDPVARIQHRSRPARHKSRAPNRHPRPRRASAAAGQETSSRNPMPLRTPRKRGKTSRPATVPRLQLQRRPRRLRPEVRATRRTSTTASR